MIQIGYSLCLHYVVDRVIDSAAVLVSIDSFPICADDCVYGGLGSVRVIDLLANLEYAIFNNLCVPILITRQSIVFCKLYRFLDS